MTNSFFGLRACLSATAAQAVLSAALFIQPAIAQGPPPAGAGMADDYNLCSVFGFDNKRDKDTHKVRLRGAVIEEGTIVRSEPNDQAPVVGTLPFSKLIWVLDRTDDKRWIQVEISKEAGATAQGWMEGRRALCNPEPLRADNGLDRRAVIKTEEAKKGEGVPVTAYPASSGQNCSGNQCTNLSRFDTLYIFAENRDTHRALLSRVRVPILGEDRFNGWVDTGHILRWNTAFGLRPREDLGHTVCARRSPDEARDETGDCIPMEGSASWFDTITRPVILEEDGQAEKGRVYQVAYNTTGITNATALSGNRISIDSLLKAQRQIDVFFVIDGTESMTRLMEAVKGTSAHPGIVPQIVKALQQKVEEGASFRFGFRVYRDAIRPGEHDESLGEGFPLAQPQHANDPTDKACIGDQAQHDAFATAFEPVAAKTVWTPPGVSDDYPENSFGGIYQAISDVSACSSNTKVIFVIGDAGYDAKMRATRGFEPITVEQIVQAVGDKLKWSRDASKGAEGAAQGAPVGLFFLEMPKDPGVAVSAGQKAAYDSAYELFSSQARAILGALYGKIPSDQLLVLPPGDLDNAHLAPILEGVDRYTRVEQLNKLIVDLNGGQALTTLIHQVRQNDKDAPMLYWERTEGRACGSLGKQCTSQQTDAVGTLYVRDSPDIVTEINLNNAQLAQWISMLSSIAAVNPETRQLRRLTKDAMVESLRNAIGTEPSTVIPMADVARKVGALPSRGRSPLMSYAISEFGTLQDCEIDYLGRWIRQADRILQIAQRGDFRPDFEEKPATGACALSEKGKRIPFIPGDIVAKRLCADDKECSYAHDDNRVTYYWLPQKFMP